MPSASPRIDVSSSSVSKTRAGAEPLLEAARDAVDAALDRDVLAEERAPRGSRSSASASAALIACASVTGSLARGRRRRTLERRARRERAHHLRPPTRAAAAPPPRARCAKHTLALGEVLRSELVAARRPSQRAGREQRVGVPVRADLLRRAVGGLDVGARVAEEAHRRAGGARAGAPVLADPVDEVRGDLEHGLRVVAGGGLVAQRGPRAQRRLDPALRRAHADPEPVVLADEEQRQRQPLVRERAPRCSAPACAVAWLTDASPKLQTTTASGGHACSTPSFFARSIANATPTARGRCEAIVEVCGITASSWLPKTLCRPPAIGSVARRGHAPAGCRARRRAPPAPARAR